MRPSSLDKLTWLPPYKLRRHHFAKNVILRILEDGTLLITAPKRYSLKAVSEVLQEHRHWIRRKRRALPEVPETVLPDAVNLLAFNQFWRIDYCQTNRALVLIERIHHKELVLLGNTEHLPTCIKLLSRWVIKQAKKLLKEEIESLSQRHNLPFNKLTIRRQRTMWGSCSSHHNINLNYKLIFLPPKLMEYVILHELCHTKYLDHSREFWKQLSAVCPDWRDSKKALLKAEDYLPTWM